METQAIQTIEPAALETSGAMSPAGVIEQVALIQHVMSAVMTDGQHYGTIPGCGDKPTLLKPGAEKLAMTFRLAPTLTIERTEQAGGHREYLVRCQLVSITSGQIMGEGVGSASTMESKYRWRTEATGKPVPEAYWHHRDPDLLGGHAFSPRKKGGKWEIYHKVENADIADTYNTVLKMAKKRAFVDAVLTVTAASDLFTQDIEELGVAAAEITPAPAETPKAQPTPEPAPVAKPEPAVEPSRERTKAFEPPAEWQDVTPSAGMVLTFGKYKGEALSDLVRSDPSYVAWLADNAQKADVKAEAARLLGLADDAPSIPPADAEEIPF